MEEKKYANEGIKNYWDKVKSGEIVRNVPPRGPDKVQRATKAKLDFAARLKKNKEIDVMNSLADQKSAIDTLAELARESLEEHSSSPSSESREGAQTALLKYTGELDKFHKTLLPYVAKKMPVQKAVEEDVELITLEDLQSEDDHVLLERLETDEQE